MKKLFNRYKSQIFAFLACLVAIVPLLTLFCSASSSYPNTPNIDYQIGGHSLYEFSSNSFHDYGDSLPYFPTYIPSFDSPLAVQLTSLAYYLEGNEIFAQHLISSFAFDSDIYAFSVAYGGPLDNYQVWSHDGDSYISFMDFYYSPSANDNSSILLDLYYEADGLPTSALFYIEWYELGSTIPHYEEVDLSVVDDGVYTIYRSYLSSDFLSSECVYIYNLNISIQNDGHYDVHGLTAEFYTSDLGNSDLRFDDIQSAYDNVNTDSNVLTNVLDVFSNVGTWIADSVHNLISMFYYDGSLTFLGVLAVAGLAISVIFLILSVITNFLRFRG